MLEYQSGDTGTRPSETLDVSTLAERLQKVWKESGLSQREISRRAGLTDVHFGLLLRRAKKKAEEASATADSTDADDTDVKAEHQTLRKIAAAMGLSYEWLAMGHGAPDQLAHDAPSPDPSGTRPVFGSLPNWRELRETAMLLDPGLQPWALDEVERSHPLATAPITAHQVAKLARIAMELLPPPAKH